MINLKKLYIITLPVLICSFIFGVSVKKRHAQVNVIPHPKNFPTVIVDAGHGGFDGGTSTDDGIPEKDINLDISLYLDEFLRLYGFNTILTRCDDYSLENEGLNTIRQKKTSDIHNRLKVTEENPNSIFISIHQNHFTDSKYSGMQVFYSGNFSETSSLLAQNIQECTVSLLQPHNERQIKKCGTSVYLIYNAKIPSCLVECGFLSNFDEAQKLKTTEYQRKIAYCIATGILNYYTKE